MEKKEKLFVIGESQLCPIYGEGKTELEISHLATNSAKKQFGQELSMDTKRSRSKYKEEEDIYCSFKVCLHKLIITKGKTAILQ